MVNTYCVDLGVSQHWAGFRLFLEAGQVFGSNGEATAQSPFLPPLRLKGPFRRKKGWQPPESRVKEKGDVTQGHLGPKEQ